MRDRSTNAMMLSGPATGSGIRHPHDASCFSLTEATAIGDTIADTVYQDPPSRAQPWRTPTPSGTGMAWRHRWRTQGFAARRKSVSDVAHEKERVRGSPIAAEVGRRPIATVVAHLSAAGQRPKELAD